MVHSVGISTNGAAAHDPSRVFQPKLEKAADHQKPFPGSTRWSQTEEAPLFNEQQVEKEIENFNSVMKAADQSLRFRFHKEAEMLIVELYDYQNNEVIKSLPPEYLLELSVKMKELIGLFVDERL